MPSFEAQILHPGCRAQMGPKAGGVGGLHSSMLGRSLVTVEFLQENRGNDKRGEGKAASPEVQWLLRGTPFASENDAFRS